MQLPYGCLLVAMEKGGMFFLFVFFVFAAPAERQAAVLSVLIVTDTVVGHESAE